jgi:hypothetical protein
MNRSQAIDYAVAATAFFAWAGPFLVDWLKIDGFPKAGHELARAIIFAGLIRLWYTTHSGGARTVADSLPPPPPVE